MTKTPRQPTNWLHEPLLHFVILAGLLFSVDYLSTKAHKEKIVVSKVTADFLIRQREELMLRELSPEERRQAIDQYIEEEILYSEAYKRGLDRGDSRMRRNLIFKIRGLLAGEIGDPTAEDLLEYYEHNRDRFAYSETWALEQVLFNGMNSVPEGLVAELNNGLDANSVGDERYDLPRIMPSSTQRDIVGVFGPDAARMILAIDDDQWHGPFESRIGANIVRITGHNSAIDPPFESVEPYLEGEWRLAKTRERVELEIEKLRDDYEIVVEGMGSEQ